MIVTCTRCGGSYDMDMEEGWDEHHAAPDGSECNPGCFFIHDMSRFPPYCITDHGAGDWKVDTVTVDDEDVVDEAAAVDERPAAPPGPSADHW